ncbi:MAG: FecR family protein [Pseudomonadota bacterium]
MVEHGPASESDEAAMRDAASEWFVRLRDEPVSAAMQADFEAWRNADPAHAQAFSEMERLWSGLDQISPPLNANQSAIRPFHPESRESGFNRHTNRLRLWSMAACLLIAVGIGSYHVTPDGLMADNRTATGAQSKITLEDGSIVHLNTASALSSDFTAGQRLLQLYQGEAFFEVTGDPDRPFVVETRFGQVQALGTAFVVRNAENEMEVTVTESQVRVSDLAGNSVTLSSGESVKVSEESLARIANPDPSKALAWRHGRLVFDNQPLAQVVAELERYRGGKIMVLDEDISKLPVTGSFSLHDTDATLQFIEDTLPVEIRRVTDWLVLLQPGDTRQFD